MLKRNEVLIAAAYGLVLLVVPFRGDPAFADLSFLALGALLLVVPCSYRWGIRAGLLSAVWSSVVLILAWSFQGGNPAIVAGGIGVYFLVAVFIGHLTDIMRRQQQSLRERVKELNTLNQLAEILSDPELSIGQILQEAVHLLPPSFFSPENTHASISFDGQNYASNRFQPGMRQLERVIMVHGDSRGTLQLYLADDADATFLTEEERLLSTVTRMIEQTLERKLTAEQLRANEEDLAVTLQSIGDGVISTDTEGRITHINRRAEQLTGWPANEAEGRPVESVLQIESAGTGDPIDNPGQRALESNGVVDLPEGTVLVARDGTRRHIADSASPITSVDGSVRGAVIVFSDDTERYRAIERLRESEAKFKAYIAKSPLGIFVANMEGHYVEVNRMACQMSGYTEEELLNLAIPDFIAPDFLEQGMEVFGKLLAEGYAQDDIMVRTKNGEVFWISLTAVTVASNRVIAFCQDITKSKQAEEALEFKNVILKTQQEASLDGILVVNERVDIVSFNSRFADIWDIPGDTMASQSGQEALAYVLPKLVDPEGFVNLINYLNENRQEKRSEEIVLRDGKILELYSAPMYGRNERYYGRVYYYRDITKRKDAEEKIRYLSYHDGLTGLYNRVYLEMEMDRLDTERQLPIGVIMADLNALKLVNDSFGHEAGDEMLKQTAEVLRDSCREEDIIARWGGDEFLIFLPQTTAEDAKAICKRIDEKCEGTFVEGIPLSLALGFATKDEVNRDLAGILEEAEESMYKHKLEESQSVKSKMIKRLLEKLETKSFETQAHYSVMQNVAERIGKKMGLSQPQLTALEMLIRLHDIGEVTISEDILKKKDPLTAEEWGIIEKHPETGYRIVHATEEFAHVAEGIRSHHEHWDGLGYPNGLKGEEIPLLGRITAVADAYEVMSSGRPYKEAMSREEIVAELKSCAGSQFDPGLIAIFLSLLEEEAKANY